MKYISEEDALAMLRTIALSLKEASERYARYVEGDAASGDDRFVDYHTGLAEAYYRSIDVVTLQAGTIKHKAVEAHPIEGDAVNLSLGRSVVCYDCALKDHCPLMKPNHPFVSITRFDNGNGIVQALCHVAKGGAE